MGKIIHAGERFLSSALSPSESRAAHNFRAESGGDRFQRSQPQEISRAPETAKAPVITEEYLISYALLNHLRLT